MTLAFEAGGKDLKKSAQYPVGLGIKACAFSAFDVLNLNIRLASF